MRRAFGSITLLTLLVNTPALAQAEWRLTLDVGATSFSPAAHDTSTDQVNLRPWHPTTFSLRATRDAGKLGAGLTLGVSNGPLGVDINNFALLDGTTALLIEVAPELRYRIVGVPNGGALHVSAGPILDVWTPQDDDTRTTFGGIGALTLSLPLTGAWLVDVRGDFAVTGSLLTEEEESPGLIRESTMRRGRLALGITKKL